MKTLSSLLLLASFMLGASPLCLADWSGRLEIHGGSGAEGKDSAPQQGKIFSKKGKVRFEVSAQGHDMIILADSKANTAAMLMPAQKMVMEMPASMSDNKALTCSTDNIEACLKAKGYKKTGKDTVDGHPCVVYEGDESKGNAKSHQKLWRPTDMEDVFMIKSQMINGAREITTYVKDLKREKLADSLFQIPSDYKKMQMPDFGSMHR